MSTWNARSKMAVCVAGAVLLGGAPGPAVGESYVAEITAKQVNARSGPSTNYYVVVRLAAGDRVTVIGEESGWLAIAPPKGCYSLISKDYVDIGSDGNGVVNGSNVRVRAGSDLDSHRYAVQAKLDKGAEVRVLGDGGDGFLKIEPPPGSQLWIHGDYLTRVPDDRLQVDAMRAAGAIPAGRATPAGDAVTTPVNESAALLPAPPSAASIPDSGSPAGESPADRVAPSPVDSGVIVRRPPPMQPQPAEEAADAENVVTVGGGTAPSVYRDQLQEADALMHAEMDKPIEDRQFGEVLAMYESLAAQEVDRVTRLFAERRLDQVGTLQATADAVREVRGLTTDVTKQRRDALSARSKIRPIVRSITRGFDAKGELRESMIYTSPVGPKRYRLIDPNLGAPRTLCYVEIPADSKLNVADYLGRVVGVRASGKYIETGNVNPIPVVVAEELVLLDEPGSQAIELDPAGDAVKAGNAGEPAPAKPDKAAVAAVAPDAG